MKMRYTDVEVMKDDLKKEMIRLNLQKNASKTEYNKRYNKEIAPSATGVLKRTGMKWQELMAEFGFAKKKHANGKHTVGISRKHRRWDEADKREIIAKSLLCMHKYRPAVLNEFRKLARTEVGAGINTMSQHGVTWSLLYRLYYEKYGEFLNPNNSINFYIMENAKLLKAAKKFINDNGIKTQQEYTQKRQETNDEVPSYYTLHKLLDEQELWVLFNIREV
ncbi:hypothetical protein N4562_04375 [Ligilactobacillus agilis]|uniref:Uncharacterized protein n=1 Tax=Ligilactobacillus agilis TaxID=1601 RepID=A0A9Q9J8G3_9LACO|nr:hypothetical protein [Ligilactobacillus agilis]UXC64257.1 hypothetical protein N4562_04375 [Ligilactobacillus agilis]UXC66257.1 hypothetical protein N4597_04380 [Ligilactobacillus agilis]